MFGASEEARTRSPVELFEGVSDETWRWLHLEARELCPFLHDYLPGLTGDPSMERRWVGSSGRDALAQGFEIYTLFKNVYEKYAGPLTPASKILDFGCGWGRVIRFFLKDTKPENLIGIDVSAQALASISDRWCRFEQCERRPPTRLESNSFHLVYAFSVFSHLSEEAHIDWLQEFRRLMRRGGVLIVTTFQRRFLPIPSDGSNDLGDRSPEEWFKAYDRGEFCFRRLPSVPGNPDFGDAFVPERYVRERWSMDFIIHEYFDAATLGQSIIVCQPLAA